MSTALHNYRSPRVRGDCTAALLGLAGVASLCIAGAAAFRSRLLGRVIAGERVPQAAVDLDYLLMAGAFFVYLFVYVAAGVSFLVWLYRVRSNLAALGADVERSPGWAVGSFFVPFVNLVVPYLCVQEAWRVSGRVWTPEEYGGWRQARGSLVISAWWILWVVGTVFGGISRVLGRGATTPAQHEAAADLQVLRGVAMAVTAALGVWVVVALTRRQERALRERRAPDSDDGDAPTSATRTA